MNIRMPAVAINRSYNLLVQMPLQLEQAHRSYPIMIVFECPQSLLIKFIHPGQSFLKLSSHGQLRLCQCSIFHKSRNRSLQD